MKKKYARPDFNFVVIRLYDVLAFSDEESRIGNASSSQTPTLPPLDDDWLTPTPTEEI